MDLIRRLIRSLTPDPSPDGMSSRRRPGSRDFMEKHPCVYILASHQNGTLYTGVTSDLPRRIWEHKNGVTPGFSSRYGVTRLVWYETHETMAMAIWREKRIKEWKGQWKLELIESVNPMWNDLYEEIY